MDLTFVWAEILPQRTYYMNDEEFYGRWNQENGSPHVESTLQMSEDAQVRCEE